MKLLTSALVGATMFAGQAVAATLSIVGGTASTLPANYDPVPGLPGVEAGTAVTTFSAADIAGQGLSLNGKSNLRFTFLGKEAGANNAMLAMGNGETLTTNSVAGDNVTASFMAGLVNFKFTTDNGTGGSITNGSGVDGSMPLNISFLQESDHSVLVFFGDGAGDLDYDDMVIRISTVPLPAGMLLMLTAVGGLGAVARRKSKA